MPFKIIKIGSIESKERYEGESISNQSILFPMDRDGHDLHALFLLLFSV